MVPTQLRQCGLGSCCHLGWLPVKGGAPECTKKDHRLRKLLLRGGHSSHRNYVMHWPRMQNCYGTRHLHTCYDCYANPVSIRRVRFKSDLKTLDLGAGEQSPPAALRGGSSEGLPGHHGGNTPGQERPGPRGILPKMYASAAARGGSPSTLLSFITLARPGLAKV